jgi:SAM-dependent methyltransferase
VTGEWFSLSGPGPSPGPESTQTPSPARVYNYLLDGKDHGPADRDFGTRLIQAAPDIVEAARQNYAFTRRAVRFMATHGVRQFIDLGTGLPTGQTVHQIAQRVNPGTRVVYVDNDPIVLTHARALLARDGSTAVINADIRTPGVILTHPDLTDLIDPDKPIGVLMFAVLHFVTDTDDPHRILSRFRDAMAPGSYLGLSHAVPAPGIDEAAAMYTREATEPATTRTPDEIARFFDGLTLTRPGLVAVNKWRRRSTRTDVCIHGGIAIKPTHPEPS